MMHKCEIEPGPPGLKPNGYPLVLPQYTLTIECNVAYELKEIMRAMKGHAFKRRETNGDVG